MVLQTFHVRVEGDDEVMTRLNALPQQVERASRRAVDKVVDRIAGVGARQLAKAHDIPAKAFTPKAGRDNNSRYRGRVIKKKARDGRSGYVWFGYNPIKSGYIGRLRNAPAYRGAFARRYFFKGGFIAQMKSGHRGIFKRLAGVSMRSNRRRQAIEETTVTLAHAERVIHSIHADNQSTFKRVFAHELNYEVNVRGRAH